MAKITAISWTDHTANFWQGCTKVGPGCDHCYAEARDKRFHAGAHWGAGAPRLPRLDFAAVDLYKWNRAAMKAGKRRRVFINSLADFFDNEVPQAWRDFAFPVFKACEWLDIQLLTKRPGNVMKMLPPTWRLGCPVNVFIGMSIVNQEEYDRDIEKFLTIPARRFLSIEPVLGPINLGVRQAPALWTITHKSEFDEFELTERAWKIHWVIVGGESGHGARPMHPGWARSIRDQCATARIPFHFKQWGEFGPLHSLTHKVELDDTILGAGEREPMVRYGKKRAGHVLDWREHLEFPK